MSQRHRISRRAVLAGLAATATGCLPPPSEPLRRPPPELERTGPRPPVVFIHGSFGSRLRDHRSGHEIWPGSGLELLFSAYDSLTVPIDPDTALQAPDAIEAHRLFGSAGELKFYESSLRMLEDAAGYLPTTAGTPVSGEQRRQYVLLYDWRRDFASVAVALGSLIETIRRDLGDPTLKVDLVTHSSGGLVANWFLLYGATPLPDAGLPTVTYAGCARVRRLVAVGAPRIGITRVAAALAQGEPIGLSRVRPEVLTTCDSVLELLPQGYDTWLLDERGEPLERDPFDVETWRELRAGIFDPDVRSRVIGRHGGGTRGEAYLRLLERSLGIRLARARRFSAALWQAPRSLEVPQIVIGGNCRQTQGRLLVERPQGRHALRVRPADILHPRPGLDYDALMLEMGDGMVTASSLLARPAWPTSRAAGQSLEPDIRYHRWICADHNQLFSNSEGQLLLLEALLLDDDELSRLSVRPAA